MDDCHRFQPRRKLLLEKGTAEVVYKLNPYTQLKIKKKKISFKSFKLILKFVVLGRLTVSLL